MTFEQKLYQELAISYSTPLYIYDSDKIKSRYKDLFKHISFPKLKILYAMKANYNPAILKLLKSLGASIDAVSPGDVLLASRCGFNKEEILYTANNITDAEMKEVSSFGVLFNIGSQSELERYGKLFPNTPVCLRINPDVVAGSHEKIQTGGDLTKFGILLEDFGKCLELISRYNLKLVGIHKHTGSGIKEMDKFLRAVDNLTSLAINFKDKLPDLSFLDFGGGLFVPYHPGEKELNYEEFGKQISDRLNSFSNAFGKQLELYFEPGKYMIAEAGSLLVEVNTIKNNKGRIIVGTNSGFPQLIRPVFYDAYHHILNISNPNGELKTYDICGNICETGDHFAKERLIPEIREGDLLLIQNAGAYCYAMGGVYNLRAMPAEVLVEDGKVTLARKRLNNAELVESILKECAP